MPVVAGVVASSAVPMSAPVIDHQQTYNVPMLDHMHSHSDDLQQVVHNEECPVRLSYPRCTQCHRCHNPARRCRCFSCGNMHYSSLPCVMSIANALRCHICNLSHAPGPCAADTGPLAAHCDQCGRWHLPCARCRCRLLWHEDDEFRPNSVTKMRQEGTTAHRRAPTQSVEREVGSTHTKVGK